MSLCQDVENVFFNPNIHYEEYNARMPYYVFAWIASFVYGLEVVTGKITSKYTIKNPLLFNFLWTVFVVAFTLPVGFYFHVGLPHEWGSVIIASLLYALGGILFSWSLYALDVSVFSPMFNIRTALSVLIGVIFLKEVLSISQYFLVALVFFGGIAVSLDERFRLSSFSRKDIAIVLLYMLNLALMGAAIKVAMGNNGFWEVTVWMQVLGLLWLFATIPWFYSDVKGVKIAGYQSLAIVGLIETIGNAASYRAYKENVSITTAIIAIPFSFILTLIIALIWPKLLERHSWKVYAVRICATALMIGATLGLSL